MSQLIPPSSHTPPTGSQPSQTTDPEAPPVTTVVAKQDIEPRNPQWQDIIMGFCFTSALQIALQYTKTPSQLPLSFHLLSLTVVLTFSALFVAKLISSKYPVSAQVVDEVAVFFVTTAFFLAITIPMPLCLKFLAWAIYVVLLNVFVFSFFLVQEPTTVKVPKPMQPMIGLNTNQKIPYYYSLPLAEKATTIICNKRLKYYKGKTNQWN
uniref:Uncharacterized protein n=1 Tax=Quercus lobata TaxID=97700 RepID=A0A7N2RBK6_QUELO